MVKAVVGFVVKKRWKEEKKEGERTAMVPHVKVVSQPYMSRDAADTYRKLAVKDFEDNPVEGQLEVEFFVTEKKAKDRHAQI